MRGSYATRDASAQVARKVRNRAVHHLRTLPYVTDVTHHSFRVKNDLWAGSDTRDSNADSQSPELGSGLGCHPENLVGAIGKSWSTSIGFCAAYS